MYRTIDIASRIYYVYSVQYLEGGKMAKKKILVEKRNILNDIIAREFTMQELRLFSIYLGRINPRNLSTRVVRLGIKTFYRVMDMHPQNEGYLKEITKGLLTKVVYVPDEKHKNDYAAFQLFKSCKIAHDDKGLQYFEIDAHDEALPLMFEFRNDYFTYELWNVLNLESTNQFRMYEILKQREYKGERILAVTELKALLGIEKNEYPRWNNLKHWVLDACQKALKEKTDITYTYEPYIRGGRGGKIQSLRFTITKNTGYKCQLNLDEFLGAETLERIRQEGAKQEQKQMPMPDIACLGFIKEPLTVKDKQAILEEAKGDIEIVKKAYVIRRPGGGVGNLTGWLIHMVRGIMSGEISAPVKANAQSRFVNFTQRDIDFAELEQLEFEQLKKSLGAAALLEESELS